MEKFRIECTACWKTVGEGTRQESVQLAVAHLRKRHRLVPMPDPALSLIRLHPFYSLEVVSVTEVITPDPAAADQQEQKPPEGGAPGGGGDSGNPGPPANQN